MANTTLTEAQMKELLKKIQHEQVKALYHNSDLSFMLSAYNGINEYDPRQMESYFSVSVRCGEAYRSFDFYQFETLEEANKKLKGLRDVVKSIINNTFKE